MTDSVFDVALEKRFTDSGEIAIIDVTSGDMMLIRNSETGVILRISIATLASAAAPVQSVAGRTGIVTLSKSDVGLSNVSNTADTDKPVSTAQQAALDTKANKEVGLIHNQNLNLLTVTGKYAGYGLTNTPFDSNWSLVEVFNAGNEQIWQRITNNSYSSPVLQVKQRGSLNNGSTWTAWQ